MSLPTWMDKYPRVKALLDADTEALDTSRELAHVSTGFPEALQARMDAYQGTIPERYEIRFQYEPVYCYEYSPFFGLVADHVCIGHTFVCPQCHTEVDTLYPPSDIAEREDPGGWACLPCQIVVSGVKLYRPLAHGEIPAAATHEPYYIDRNFLLMNREGQACGAIVHIDGEIVTLHNGQTMHLSTP